MKAIKLHDKYYEKIRKFVLFHIRDDWSTDDIVQETFIRVDKKFSSLKDKNNLSAWIYKIAYNLCMDYLKNSQTRIFKQSQEITSQITGIEIQKKMEQNQMGACVREKIDQLPEKYRSVLLLFDLEGFSHDEISRILDISSENAKVRLHRSRKMLKQILEKECSFEKDERDVFVCTPKSEPNKQKSE